MAHHRSLSLTETQTRCLPGPALWPEDRNRLKPTAREETSWVCEWIESEEGVRTDTLPKEMTERWVLFDYTDEGSRFGSCADMSVRPPTSTLDRYDPGWAGHETSVLDGVKRYHKESRSVSGLDTRRVSIRGVYWIMEWCDTPRHTDSGEIISDMMQEEFLMLIIMSYTALNVNLFIRNTIYIFSNVWFLLMEAWFLLSLTLQQV